MSATPLISVVIPCYNQGHFLREALETVAASPRGVEIVVVDDGSLDHTLEIADRFAAQRANGVDVRVLQQSNAGVSAARNRGFAESRGEYVVFLDADDRLTPDGLDVGARALDAHPQCAFVYGRCQMMDADGTLLPTPMQTRIEHHHYHELLRRNYIWTPAIVMFRRDALERTGVFNPVVSGSADYELYLRIARTYPIHDHGHVVAHYRRHPANMSANAAAMLRETLMVLRSQRPYIGDDADGAQAFREGWRSWQDFYGEQLVAEIRADVGAARWFSVLRKSVVLAVLYPRGLAHHAWKKTVLVTQAAQSLPAKSLPPASALRLRQAADAPAAPPLPYTRPSARRLP